MLKRILSTLLFPLLVFAQAPQVAVVTRASKTTALTIAEADKNFTDLQAAVNASVSGFGRNAASTSGLTFGFFGGTAWNGTYQTTAAGTILLAASSTNFVQLSPAFVVVTSTSGWMQGAQPLYLIATDSSTITSVVDQRSTLINDALVLNGRPVANTPGLVNDSSSSIATSAFVQGTKQQYPVSITNKILWSSDLSNAAWSKASSGTGSAPTLTAAFAAAPDGTTSAARLQCSQGSGFSSSDYSMVTSGSVAVTIGDVLRCGVWLKSNTGSPQPVYFGLSGSTHALNCVMAGTTWKRYTIPWEVAAAGSVTLQIGLRGAGNLFYYTPASSTLDVLVWGPSVTPMAETATAINLAAEGDSITIGNSITGAAWPRVVDLPPGSAVTNFAVAGSDTTAMVTRFNGYKGGGYTHFSVMGGINDIRYGTNTLAQIQANLSYMWDTAASLGMAVTCITCTPFKGNSLWTAQGQAEEDALNAWIRQYAALKGYNLLDAFALLQDPANADQLLGAFDIGDHIHPTPLFASTLGYAQRLLLDGDRSVPYIPTVGAAQTVTNYPGLPTPIPTSLGGLGNTTGLAATANAIASATTIVNFNSAAAPTTGQQPYATSTTTAGWRFSGTATKTGAYTLTGSDDEILADATAGAFTVTLPSASTVTGKAFVIIKGDSSANAVTIGGTVNGVSNPTLAAQYNYIKVYSNGALWFKISG